MYKGKRILGIIPARAGSKGLPRKNILPILGKPLIAWTIEEARSSKYLDKIIVSTESDEIAGISKKYGAEVPFKRPKDLATDEAKVIDVIFHARDFFAKKNIYYDFILLLQPTSPLRKAEDIDGCIELCFRRKANACVSVTEPDKSPYWTYLLNSEGKMRPLIKTGGTTARRQDLPKVYILNGAVYIAKSKWLEKERTFVTKETLGYFMPKERSLDIDTEIDFKFISFLASRGAM